MGKSKRFIGKNEGSHYHLMHRSTTDKAHAGEENPSNYVLVLKDKRGNKSSTDITPLDLPIEEYFSSSKDHITSLGFKNDGYDYAQHLKSMGGGKFIGKDGKVRDMDYQKEPLLPEDALPSGEEFDRDLNAVTIDPDVMDEDLRAALFGDTDEFGEFEELQDDFILEAMQEPIVPDFDFDAHVAGLIARSERAAQGVQAPRGWDVVEDDEDDELNNYLDSKYDNMEDFSVTTSGLGGKSLRLPKNKPLTRQEQALLDAEFDKTLEEYDDEAIGDLEDVSCMLISSMASLALLS
jgi:hypothetical protein